ncbi:MAG TPA: hypothetical protein PLH37_02390 [bacterium]|nr:hypothetical protein [bacterium]
MFLLKRLSPFLVAILNLVFLEAILKWPSLFFVLACLVLFLNLFFVGFLAVKNLGFKATGRFWLTYFMLTVSVSASFLFIDNVILRQVLIVIYVLVIAAYQEFLFNFLYRPEKYKVYSLENLNNVINLLTVFLANLSIFALIVFMDMVFWLSLLIEIGLISCSLILLFYANKLELKGNGWLLVTTGLIVTEFFTIFTWLPFNFFIKAVLISALYYLLSGVAKLIVNQQLYKKNFLVFLSVAVVVWVALFATSRWI